MSNRWIVCTALALPLLVRSPADAAPAKPAPVAGCPEPVKGAIAHAFPGASITGCKAEHEHGHDQFEVKLVKSDGANAEVDVSPDGKVLQIEEKVGLDKLPAAVTKAFAAKYPRARLDAAEKQTHGDGAVTYELGFAADGGRKEATFTEAGKFVEEE